MKRWARDILKWHFMAYLLLRCTEVLWTFLVHLSPIYWSTVLLVCNTQHILRESLVGLQNVRLVFKIFLRKRGNTLHKLPTSVCLSLQPFLFFSNSSAVVNLAPASYAGPAPSSGQLRSQPLSGKTHLDRKGPTYTCGTGQWETLQFQMTEQILDPF